MGQCGAGDSAWTKEAFRLLVPPVCVMGESKCQFGPNISCFTKVAKEIIRAVHLRIIMLLHIRPPVCLQPFKDDNPQYSAVLLLINHVDYLMHVSTIGHSALLNYLYLILFLS